VINTDILSHTVSKLLRTAQYRWNFCWWMGVPVFNALFLSNLWEYHRKYILPKCRVFGLQLCCRQECRSNFEHSDVDPKATEFSEMTQNDA